MFNYFIPKAAKDLVAPGDKLDHAYLASIGLGEVLADLREVPADAMVVFANVGPAEVGGTFIVPTRKYSGVPQVRYDAGLQTWKAANGGKFWVGWLTAQTSWLGAPPRELERKETVAGVSVKDEQGNEWLVPIARAPQFGSAYGMLPQSFGFDELGKPVPQLLPRFQWLWDLSGEIQDWYRIHASGQAAEDGAAPAEQPAQKPEDAFNQLVQFAARLLSVNYRVSHVEINALLTAGIPVLTNSTVNTICRSSFGWDVQEEAKKKPPVKNSSPAGSSSSSTTGGETLGDAPGIAPAAELLPQPQHSTN